MNKYKNCKQKGITLIALVITIVVMLILVAVTISMAVKGGLFTQAGKSAKEMNNEIRDEQELAYGGVTIDGTGYNSIDNYINSKPVKWDGISINTSWYNDEDTEFTIKTGEELAGLAQLVNAGNYFVGKTIYLEGNIDLDNKEWTSIGATSYFSGKFYGQNNCIYNLKSSNKNYDGLFGLLSNAEIKDLSISNISIDGSIYTGGIAAYVTGTSTIQNIKLSGNISINGTYNIGGIIGCVQETTTIQDIEIIGDVKITGPYYVGGVSGYCTGIPTIQNVNINVKEGSYIKGTASDSINNAGGIVGTFTGRFTEPNINFAKLENCYSNIDVIISGAGAGGIVGYTDAAIIKNCTCDADVTLDAVIKDEEYLTIGGISGYTCHSGDVNNVTIESCKYNGNLIYKVNGQNQEEVEFSNNGIAGCDRIYISQNLIIKDCEFNGIKIDTTNN